MSDTEHRLIDAYELKRIAYQRFGLEAIKLITLIDEMPTGFASPICLCGNPDKCDKKEKEE